MLRGHLSTSTLDGFCLPEKTFEEDAAEPPPVPVWLRTTAVSSGVRVCTQAFNFLSRETLDAPRIVAVEPHAQFWQCCCATNWVRGFFFFLFFQKANNFYWSHGLAVKCMQMTCVVLAHREGRKKKRNQQASVWVCGLIRSPSVKRASSGCIKYEDFASGLLMF